MAVLIHYSLFSQLILFTALVLIGAGKEPYATQNGIQRKIGHTGETVRLQCPVSSDPEPIVQWIKDGEAINSAWDRYRIQAKSLRIRDANEEDIGSYTCEAANGFGSVSIELKLYILPNDSNATPPPSFFDDSSSSLDDIGEAPRFSRPDQMREPHLYFPAGHSTRLRCKFEGQPRPQISWYHNERRLDTSSGKYSDPNGSDKDWILYLTELDTADTGLYMCKVSNRVGSINFTYSIDVTDNHSKPVIGRPYPQNQTVAYGETATIECRVYSLIKPRIEWLKRLDVPNNPFYKQSAFLQVDGLNYTILPADKVWSSREDVYTKKLTLHGVTTQHQGVYFCFSLNEMGSSVRTAHLYVQPPYGGYNYGLKDEESSGLSLPLIIAIPATAVIIILSITMIVMHRKKDKKARSSNVKAGMTAHRSPQPAAAPADIKQHPQTHIHVNPYTALQAYHQQQQHQQQLYPLMHEQQLMHESPTGRDHLVSLRGGHNPGVYSEIHSHSDTSGHKMMPIPVPTPVPPPTSSSGGSQTPSLQTFQQHHHIHNHQHIQYPPC